MASERDSNRPETRHLGDRHRVDAGHYCPFLNRSDARCSSHFLLDQLGAAFEHCFDRYKECPAYRELLMERQFSRRTGTLARSAAGGRGLFDHAPAPFVELTITRRGGTPAGAPGRYATCQA